MRCTFPKPGGLAGSWLHRLLCRECRIHAGVDRIIALGTVCLRADPAPSDGLAGVLRAVGLDVDPELGAVIRRRRFARRARTSIVLSVAGLVGLGGGWLWWIDRDPGVTVPTPAMPAVNAYRYFAAAAASLTDARQIGDAFANMPRQSSASAAGLGAGPTGEQVYTAADKANLVARNARALELIREGLQTPYTAPPVRSFSTLLPYYADYRNLARLLALEAQVRKDRGDAKGAMASCLDAIQFGRHVQHGAVLIGKLVGMSCEAVGRSAAWKIVDALSGEEARWAAHRLGAICEERVPISETLEEEKRMGTAGLLEIMHRRAWRLGIGRDVFGASSDSAGIGLGWFAMTLPYSKGAIVRTYQANMDRCIELAQQPYAVQRSRSPVFEPTDPINRVLAPVFSQAGFQDIENETQNALLQATLALRAYRAEHGRYPAALRELTPRYLQRVPVSAFDAGELAYHRKGDGYVLYSVGPDGVDGGGAPAVNPNAQGESNRLIVSPDSVGDIVAGVNR